MPFPSLKLLMCRIKVEDIPAALIAPDLLQQMYYTNLERLFTDEL